jgi:hypothetical protein
MKDQLEFSVFQNNIDSSDNCEHLWAKITEAELQCMQWKI